VRGATSAAQPSRWVYSNIKAPLAPQWSLHRRSHPPTGPPGWSASGADHRHSSGQLLTRTHSRTHNVSELRESRPGGDRTGTADAHAPPRPKTNNPFTPATRGQPRKAMARPRERNTCCCGNMDNMRPSVSPYGSTLRQAATPTKACHPRAHDQTGTGLPATQQWDKVGRGCAPRTGLGVTTPQQPA